MGNKRCHESVATEEYIFVLMLKAQALSGFLDIN